MKKAESGLSGGKNNNPFLVLLWYDPEIWLLPDHKVAWFLPWLRYPPHLGYPTDLLVGIACGAALRLAVYLKGKNAKKFRHNEEYGSARWGKHADIEPFEDPVFANNVILSQSERITMSSRPKMPKYARNKNVLVVGGSGSGKTRFFIKPNLLQMHSSYVVTDPKGYTIRG